MTASRSYTLFPASAPASLLGFCLHLLSKPMQACITLCVQELRIPEAERIMSVSKRVRPSAPTGQARMRRSKSLPLCVVGTLQSAKQYRASSSEGEP